MEIDYNTYGKHSIVDLYGVEDCSKLDDMKFLRKTLREAVKLSNATLLKITGHKFKPQGITLTAILSESSIDLHTYPEKNFMSASIYTCGNIADPEAGTQHFIDIFKPTKVSRVVLNRGHGTGLVIGIRN